DRDAAPAAQGSAGRRLPAGQRPCVLPLHEDDHPGRAAALPARWPGRGARRRRYGAAGAGRRGTDDQHRTAWGCRMSEQERDTSSHDWEAAADLVVVGSGVAGLSAALAAREAGLRVLVVTKAGADDGNTRWAQGGVAVVLPGEHDRGDTVAAHVTDTLTAG